MAIRAADGVTLRATVWGGGVSAARRPAVIILPGWGGSRSDGPPLAPRDFATALAQRGFPGLAYDQRGFGESGGAADLAGAATIRDVTAAAHWLSRHGVDPGRVGVIGVSYGAGVALLAAAHDAPVRAVAAIASWSDLYDALAPGGWVTAGYVSSLLAACAGRCTPLVTQAASDIAAHRRVEHWRALLDARSPIRSVADPRTDADCSR